MRLIPGNTKVQIEIFKGITLWDILVGALGLITIALILSSSLLFKIAFIAVVVLIEVVLLARMDNEPNYMYLLYIIRHFSYKRRFNRIDTDKDIVDNIDKTESEIAFDDLFGEEEEEKEKNYYENIDESWSEIKKRYKAEKKERKADDKLLKSKALSKEEEDAIWLKRASQYEARKERIKQRIKNKYGDDWSDMEDLSSFSDIADGFIDFHGEYYGAAIEIPAVEFRFFSEYRRDNAIENGIGSILRAVKPEYCCNILKIERPINYERYEDLEYKKVEELKKSFENGFLNEEELQARLAIVYDRITEIQDLLGMRRVVVPFYYIILFDSDKDQLNNEVRNALQSLRMGEMEGKRLDDKELALMLKYSNSLDFNEFEIEAIKPEDYAKWAMPQEVEFMPRVSVIDGIATHNFRVASFPSVVNDAWLASLMTYPSTKVMVKVKPMDSSKAIKAIDKSLSELRATVYNAKTDSQAMEAQTHLESLELLLGTLQSDNEQLLNVNIYVSAYDYVFSENSPKIKTPDRPSFRHRVADMKKTVRRIWGESGFRLNKNEFNQAVAYIGSQVSAYDPMEKSGRGMPSNTVAATFPWVFPYTMDEQGVQIGSADGIPVFVDFFERNHERVNSNMVIIGKSGSGKSFATKSLLCNLAADDAKIFVLDPEDEYRNLAANIHGKIINLATNQYGIINPFHIITSLEDETEIESSTGYASHLQFLEEFFKQILPDCDKDSLEYLNTLVDRTYMKKGIDATTDLSKLRPEDFPIFDDLYDEILFEFQRTQNDYLKIMLRTLMNYISKFSEGGRNAVLWNGPSSISTQENFIVFDFQTLLSNRNSTIANAQMLLVLKYIDNEISKNRDYNEKYGLNRKIVVVIDEAHVFIDAKYPIALDFMFQLAKRIRKYNGMQIVITQNIKDFVGSEEIARKSTAIINASQYSLIFSLAPNDMTDLCTLYEKAGGINESEQEQMIQAPRGNAFAIMSPTSRSSFTIVAPDDTRKMFSKPDFKNPYFSGEGGQVAWEREIGDLAEHRALALEERNEKTAYERVDDALKELGINFSEFTEEEYNDHLKETAGFEEIIPISVAHNNFNTADSFANFEEVSEDIDIEPIDYKSDAFADLLEPEVTAPATNAAQPIIVQQGSNRTEEILADLVDKLSTDSIIDQIKRLVKAEVDNRIESESVFVQPKAAPMAEAMPAPSFGSFISESSTESEGSDEFDITDIFGSISEDAPEKSDDESTEGTSASIGNIFDYANIYEDDDDEDDDDEESGTIDVVALLSHDMTKIIENENLIDNFVKSSDTTVEVTLEQLIAYTRKLNENKQ